jgi:hypothetical protein
VRRDDRQPAGAFDRVAVVARGEWFLQDDDRNVARDA